MTLNIFEILKISFSLDVEKMFTNIKRDGGEKEFKSLIGEEIIRGWKKKEILETLRYIWNSIYSIIEDKVVKVDDGLGMGSKMSPILTEIVMRKWEEEEVEGENKIIKFVMYVDDILGVWRGDRTELIDKI